MQNSPKRPNKKADDVHGDFNYLHFDNEEFNDCRTIPVRYFFHKNINKTIYEDLQSSNRWQRACCHRHVIELPPARSAAF